MTKILIIIITALTWFISLSLFFHWRKQLKREISFFAEGIGFTFITMANIIQLLMVFSAVTPNALVLFGYSLFLQIGLLLIYWAYAKLIFKNSLLTGYLPVIYFIIINSLSIVVALFSQDILWIISVFSWLFVVPLSLFFGIIFILSYSHKKMLYSHQEFNSLLTIGIGWFFHALSYLLIRYLLVQNQFQYFYLVLAAAYLIIFVGRLIFFQKEKSPKVVKKEEVKKFKLEDEEWEVKFL